MPDEGLTFKDTEALLLRLGEASERVVVVGGQAVNFWADFYADRVAELRDNGPFSSKDVDVCADRRDVRLFARKLEGTPKVAELDDNAPQLGTVTFVDANGVQRVLDIMADLTGLRGQEVAESAIAFVYANESGDRVAFKVMHPVHVLVSRACNVVASAKYQTEHGLGQLQASVFCAREYLKDMLPTDPKKVRDWNEYIFRFRTKNRSGKQVAIEYGVDVFDAVVIGPELGDKFCTIRYRQMHIAVQKLREARASGRPDHKG